MAKIIGDTTATPNPQPDWLQTDEKKADYIKNKPTVLTEDEVKDLIDELGGDTQIQADWEQADNTKTDYIKNKPTLGAIAAKDEVDKSDLSKEVQSALENAESALQSYTETDPTVPAWAKESTKPSYSADEVGALPITGGTLTGILRTSAPTPLIIGNEGKIGMRAAPTNAVTGVNHVGQINISNAWWNTGEGEIQNQWGTQISGYNGKTGKYNELRVSHEGVQYNAEDGSVYQVLHSGNKGAANGVAELDENGKVLSAQLPSYVDDVLEYSAKASFPTEGEAGKIYIDTSTNITYRWSGSVYTPIGSDLALGETSASAYRGDRGKAAYDHSQITSGNPHGVTAEMLGLADVALSGKYGDLTDTPTNVSQFTNDAGYITQADAPGSAAAVQDNLNAHTGNTFNPHGVTLAQLGVNATADELNCVDGVTSNIQTQLNKKANDYSIELYNGTSGNPKPVKFTTVDYATCGSENGVSIKIGMVSGHGNGTSYAFLQDAIIKVNYVGTVTVDNFKYYGQETSYDGVTRQYGDIFWVIDTTNKIVDFYCLMGQYARVNMTPWKRLTYSSGGTVAQHTSCTVYLSGTKEWANNSDLALKSDISKTLNRNTAVNNADTNYSTLMARGEKLLDTTTASAVTDWGKELVNGAICWTYE